MRGEHEVAEATQKHVGVLWPGARVEIKAGALEVLGRDPRDGISELLADRIAEDVQPTSSLPVDAEAPAEIVLGLREVGAIALRLAWMKGW